MGTVKLALEFLDNEYDFNNYVEIIRYTWEIDLYKLKKTLNYFNDTVESKIGENHSVVVNYENMHKVAELMDNTVELRQLIQPTFNKAIFITCYSYFEFFLKDVSKIFDDYIETEKVLNDIKGKGIEKYSRFLKTQCNIDDKLFSGIEWEKIKNWQEVRNCVSHNDGVPKDDSSLEKIQKAGIWIDRKEQPQVFLHEKEVVSFIELIEKFANRLLENAKQNNDLTITKN